MKLPILYSRTSKGQTQTWLIEYINGQFRTHEGILDGAITVSNWTSVETKNDGKANATTIQEQARKEAEAKWKKKTETGYWEDIKDIDKSKYIEPMLAKSVDDHWDKVTYPVWSQPKLDGMRCIIEYRKATSRNGKAIVSVPHIPKAYEKIIEKFNLLFLDGEIYTDKLKNDFDKLISLAKKGKPTQDDLIESEKYLQHWVYDVYADWMKGWGFERRNEWINSNLNLVSDYIVTTPTTMVNNLPTLNALYESYLEKGYEGQMIRFDTSYEFKRTKNLLKRKEFKEEEFQLVDLQEGRGNREKMATRAVFKLDDGRPFETGVMGSFAFCRRILKEKQNYVGKLATVKFQSYTPDAIPRFGKLKYTDRDYE